ncbi:MAG TPA: CHAP domain-containing protein [Ktedonobacterales bacterium]|nr:CHAP domain-containing protein [Ktedonobacterales bacterium]
MTQLLAFIAQYLGLAGTGTTPENRGQCVGLVEAWLAAQQLPAIGGNAVDLLRNADLRTYRVIHNLPTNFPHAGDIVCWNSTWGGGFGHTAVVIAAGVTRLAVFEQNDPAGAPPLVATHDYSGVAGWIVLPGGAA